jgi:hypothetical protein
MRQGWKVTVVLAALGLVIGGCASAATTTEGSSSTDLRPLAVGGERYFKIDWQAGQRDGTSIVSGSVENMYGATAWRVQLLVEGLDENGRLANQKVAWLGGDIAPFGSEYFEVPVQKFPQYRVRVFAYDWIQSADLLF